MKKSRKIRKLKKTLRATRAKLKTLWLKYADERAARKAAAAAGELKPVAIQVLGRHSYQEAMEAFKESVEKDLPPPDVI